MMIRAADRILHEVDHLPHRLQGRRVPDYVPRYPAAVDRDDQIGKQVLTDHGEPHDEPSPFPISGQKARHTAEAARDRPQRRVRAETTSERRTRELHELQEKLRNMR